MPSTSPCSWTQERIEAYIDDELTPVEQGQLEAHAATCAACAAELEDARRLVGTLRALPSGHLPRRGLSSSPDPDPPGASATLARRGATMGLGLCSRSRLSLDRRLSPIRPRTCSTGL